jgi:hypothetical protein
MMDKPKTLHAALVHAQSLATAVEKSSTNSHQRYAYASAEAIMQTATECLAAAGLAWVCKSWCLADSRPSGDGHFADVVAVFELVHESGETRDCGPYTMPAIAGRGRPGDKAISTALTYLSGYGLRGLLNLPRVEQGHDVDQRNDADFKPAQRQQQARQQGGDGDREEYLKRWRKAWQALVKAKGADVIVAELGKRGIQTTQRGKGVSLQAMQKLAAEMSINLEAPPETKKPEATPAPAKEMNYGPESHYGRGRYSGD